MEGNINNNDINTIDSTVDIKNGKKDNLEMKPYVMRNFAKELKRVRWPIKKEHNRSFVLIFVFVFVLMGFFALISFGATQIIELIGAK